MRAIVICLLFSFTITNTVLSQVFYGQVTDFPENLDMTKIESYKKISEKYGGFRFDRLGILDFKSDGILFMDGKSNSMKSNFLDMKLDFEHKEIKNGTVFSEVCGELTSLPQFFMVDANNDKVKIQYFLLSRLPFGTNEDGGFFVIKTSDQMYVLFSESDEYNKIFNLYK